MIQRFKKMDLSETRAVRLSLYILFRIEGMSPEQARDARDRIEPRTEENS